jgi:hypothetical protein
MQSKYSETLVAKGVYHVECYDKDGNLCWHNTSRNLITDQGKNAMLDSYFAGTNYSAAFYMSLIMAGTAINTSTYASPMVTEVPNSVIATRSAVIWMGASDGIKDAVVTTFSIIGTATIIGNMLVSGSDTSVVGDTSASDGILFSSANLDAGSQSVNSGDILMINYSISV